MLEGLADWVTTVVESFGYGGVALLVLIENVFPPIPSEVVLALAGFAASRGETSVVGMIGASTAGSLGGALVLYFMAAVFGAARLRRIVVGQQRWLRITNSDMDRAEAWFDRWSGLAVLVCRCVPLVRSLISVPAGLRRMAIVPFVVLTTLGSLAWNTLFVTSGYLLGENWHLVVDAASYAQYVVVGAGASLAVVGAFRWRARGRQARLGRDRLPQER